MRRRKCNELSLLPNFLHFKVGNEHLRHSATYKTNQKNFLFEEIRHKTSSIATLKTEQIAIQTELRKNLNAIDLTHIISCFLKSNDKFINEHRVVQDKKICKLAEKSNLFCNDPS